MVVFPGIASEWHHVRAPVRETQRGGDRPGKAASLLRGKNTRVFSWWRRFRERRQSLRPRVSPANEQPYLSKEIYAENEVDPL